MHYLSSQLPGVLRPFILLFVFLISTLAHAADAASNPRVEIETPYGSMQLRLFADTAPGHVENFIKLTREGFYDGTIFHRVIPGFMIQGGDPNTKGQDKSRYGTGGPGYSIKAEFSDLPHKRGVLSMARSRDPDSAGSQFFIVVDDARFLDGQYTVFGEVTSGMEVADKIVSQDRDARDNPLQRIEMKVRLLEPAAVSAGQ